jgi:AcrR family transcriptional regulator
MPKPPMRDALIEAAFELFPERGYDATTVDDIVARAGVGRRSFFRYFPTKEDVVFPDHEHSLADMRKFLATARDDEDPVEKVCDAARLVLRLYAGNPAFSVQRYRLTRQVPGLRAYELSVVRRYQQALATYLRERFAGSPQSTLRADVIAASVVAAHNHALRSWLRAGGTGDVWAAVDEALALVRGAWHPDGSPAGTAAPQPEDVVVLVARRGTPMWRVVRDVQAALEGPADGEAADATGVDAANGDGSGGGSASRSRPGEGAGGGPPSGGGNPSGGGSGSAAN